MTLLYRYENLLISCTIFVIIIHDTVLQLLDKILFIQLLKVLFLIWLADYSNYIVILIFVVTITV